MLNLLINILIDSLDMINLIWYGLFSIHRIWFVRVFNNALAYALLVLYWGNVIVVIHFLLHNVLYAALIFIIQIVLHFS